VRLKILTYRQAFYPSSRGRCQSGNLNDEYQSLVHGNFTTPYSGYVYRYFVSVIFTTAGGKLTNSHFLPRYFYWVGAITPCPPWINVTASVIYTMLSRMSSIILINSQKVSRVHEPVVKSSSLQGICLHIKAPRHRPTTTATN